MSFFVSVYTPAAAAAAAAAAAEFSATLMANNTYTFDCTGIKMSSAKVEFAIQQQQAN